MVEAGATTKLRVRVVPRARRNAVRRGVGGAWQVRLVAPPVDGKANAALAEFLAHCLDVPRRSVQIVGGEKSRDKLVAIEGLSAAEIEVRLDHA